MMIEFVKICWGLAVFVLLQQSSGAVVKNGLEINHELQAIEKILKSQPFNTLMCTKGPSFWCENLSNAIGCNAVRHCIETTWNSQKYPKGGVFCTTCITIVKTELKKFHLNDTTKERIYHDMNDICNVVPLKNTDTKCKKTVDQVIDYIVNTLNTIDPKEICILVGMCDNDMDYLLPESKKEASNIEDGILFFGKSYIRNEPTPEQLSNIDNTGLMNELPFLNKDKCSTCLNMLNKIEKEISYHQLKEIIKISTEEFCYEFLKFPSEFQKPCKQFLDQYVYTLMSYLVKEINSSTICPALKMCQVMDQSLISTNFIGSIDAVQVLSIIDVMFSRNNMKRLFSERDIELIVENNQSYICEICTFSMKYLHDRINGASAKAVIEDVLEDFCNVLPARLDDMCTTFIHNNFQSILTIFLAATDPDLVCSLPCNKVDGTKQYGLDDLKNMLK